MRWSLLSIVALGACGSDPQPPPDPPLGMNDVTILLPLPADPAQPVLARLFDSNPALVDPFWFDAMVFTRRDLGAKDNTSFTRNSFHLVAVRFDLCDRIAPGPCPAGADGRLRLVAQPLVTAADSTVHALDVGVHLFYPIPAAELPAVIGELRDLAALRDQPDGPLAVTTGDAAYLAQLRALVLRYAQWPQLVKFTANGQHQGAVGNSWLFRELDQTPDGASYVPALIPNANAYEQDALLQGGDITYVSEQITDRPPGFESSIDGLRFMAESPEDQAAAVDAIAAMENPVLHDAFDTQCLGCHVGSYIGPYRAGELGIDIATSASWYHSARDLSVPAPNTRHVRGLGYFDTEVVISQAAANETANVLDEIETQFPER
jgi:hypothetical protein